MDKILSEFEEAQRRILELEQQVRDLSSGKASNHAAPPPPAVSSTLLTQLCAESQVVRLQSANSIRAKQQTDTQIQNSRKHARDLITAFEGLIRGPAFDAAQARSFSASRDAWLDAYAGRTRPEEEPPSGTPGIRLPKPSEPPRPPPMRKLQDVRLRVLGGASMNERDMSIEKLAQISEAYNMYLRSQNEGLGDDEQGGEERGADVDMADAQEARQQQQSQQPFYDQQQSSQQQYQYHQQQRQQQQQQQQQHRSNSGYRQ
ncbi:hypothetical protein OC845_004660 [Tilletia horrida]|nr:hypothetical protein OC845_004660 [Tilletia horrida]